MHYAIVTAPIAPLRKGANHRFEMTNQLFFGEAVRIIKQKDETWLKIESLYDGYQGWLTTHLITKTDEAIALQKCNQLAPQFINTIEMNGLPMQIPLGVLKNKNGKIAENITYHFRKKPICTDLIDQKSEQLIYHAMQWLNAPYLWGGKTILGVDCSGFCQTMFKLIGVPIWRDARQQALQGTSIKKLQDVQPCDLAFFDDKEEIVHVGILLGPDKIIHSSGTVRIDRIDKQGIINSDTGRRTHQLKLIRRIL